jgi:hypothetical protein
MNQNTFSRILQQHENVVVLISTTECRACKLVKKWLPETNYFRVDFVMDRMDDEFSDSIISLWHIRSFPTFVKIQSGSVIGVFVPSDNAFAKKSTFQSELIQFLNN